MPSTEARPCSGCPSMECYPKKKSWRASGLKFDLCCRAIVRLRRSAAPSGEGGTHVQSIAVDDEHVRLDGRGRARHGRRLVPLSRHHADAVSVGERTEGMAGQSRHLVEI